MPEAILTRYLSVFLPWCATVVLGHLILRTSGSPLVSASGLASPRLLRRLLAATGVAMAVIVATDLVTGGELFLAPRFPSSPLLLGVIAVTAASLATVGRLVSALRERRRRN